MTSEMIELSRLSRTDPRPPPASERPAPGADRPVPAADRPAPAADLRAPAPAPPVPASERPAPSADDFDAGVTTDMPAVDFPDWEDEPRRRPEPSDRPAPDDDPDPGRPGAPPLPLEAPRATPPRAPRLEVPTRHRPATVELAPGIEPPAGLRVDPTPDLDPGTGTLTPAEREAHRTTARVRREARPPNTLSAWRVRIADWLLLGAGIALVLSLFLPWSHQFSPQILARYGHSPMLAGVPRSPDGWQVYSIVDVIFALLAGGAVATAFAGVRAGRLALAGAALIALVFTLHAIAHAPTNGANIVNTAAKAGGYLPDHARSGTGEEVALIALIALITGVGLSVIRLPRR